MDLLTLVLIIAVIAVLIFLVFQLTKKNPHTVRPGIPDGTVLLYGFGKAPKAPSLSPFCIKMETFCRMNNIPYTNNEDVTFSSKGKLPWMQFNGELVMDSHFCVSHLTKKLELDHSSHLNAEQKARATIVELMVADSLYPILLMERWGGLNPKSVTAQLFIDSGMPSVVSWLFAYYYSRRISNDMWAQGIARHSDEEIDVLARERLQALSDVLGGKRFMTGDTLAGRRVRLRAAGPVALQPRLPHPLRHRRV